MKPTDTRRAIILRAPTLADQAAFLRAVRMSRSLHRPWSRPPASADEYQRYLARMAQPDHAAWLVCDRASGAMVGVVNLSQMVMGRLCSGYLGYYVFAGHERKGYMRQGLHAVVRQAFKSLGLHRLEANIQPGNLASLALVRACGFHYEGYSARYLKLGGRWCDHERWAILAR